MRSTTQSEQGELPLHRAIDIVHLLHLVLVDLPCRGVTGNSLVSIVEFVCTGCAPQVPHSNVSHSGFAQIHCREVKM
jgi:hypothetical protein